MTKSERLGFGTWDSGFGVCLALRISTMSSPEPVHEESIGGLLRGILNDLRMLVREEIALARAEIREQVGHAKTAAITFGVCAVALLVGFVLLLAAAATSLADAMQWPVWAGLLAMALLLSIIGVAAYAMGRHQLHHVHAVPQETIASVKENAEWIAKRISSGQR